MTRLTYYVILYTYAVTDLSWEFPLIRITGQFVQILKTWMTRQGLDIPRLSSRLETLAGRDALEASEWRALLAIAAQTCPQPDLGLQIGSGIRVSHTGVLGYLVLNCETLAEALETYILFEQHFYGVHFAELRSTETEWTLCWPDRLGEENALFVHVALAALVTFLRQRFPGSCRLTGVALTGAPPGAVEVFERFFGCPVHFHSTYPGVFFDAQALGQTQQGAPRGEFLAMRHQQHDAFSQVLRIDSPFTQRLRQVMLKLIPEGGATLPRVAAELHCSTRTVQRRLNAVDLGYQELLDRLREQLAYRYLQQTSLTLTELALLLGYSDQSAFTRAFRSWTGVPPGRYRTRGNRRNPT